MANPPQFERITVLPFWRALRGDWSFAKALARIESVEIKAKVKALRGNIERWTKAAKLSEQALDCLTYLFRHVEEARRPKASASRFDNIRNEIARLTPLCAFYDERVPELSERWGDIEWHPEKPREATPVSQVHGVECHTELMGIAAHRRLAMLQQGLEFSGGAQTHRRYEFSLFTPTRQFRFIVCARSERRGRNTSPFPIKAVVFVANEILREAGVSEVRARYDIIFRLLKRRGPDSIESQVLEVRRQLKKDLRSSSASS